MAHCLPNGIHIDGYPAYDIAVACFIEILQRQLVDFLRDAGTQTFGYFGGYRRHDKIFRKTENCGRRVKENKQHSDVVNGVHINCAQNGSVVNHRRKPLRDFISHIPEFIRAGNLKRGTQNRNDKGDYDNGYVVFAIAYQLNPCPFKILCFFAPAHTAAGPSHSSAEASSCRSSSFSCITHDANSSSLN